MHSDDTTRTGTGGAPAGAPPKLWRLRLLWSGRGGIASGPTTQAPFWDGAQPLLLGRSTGPTTPASPLRIDDDRASREHARLWLHGDDVWVEDLRSKNGSQINGLPLLPGAPQPITDGDILRIGNSFLVLRQEPLLAADLPVVIAPRKSAPIKLGPSTARCDATAPGYTTQAFIAAELRKLAKKGKTKFVVKLVPGQVPNLSIIKKK